MKNGLGACYTIIHASGFWYLTIGVVSTWMFLVWVLLKKYKL